MHKRSNCQNGERSQEAKKKRAKESVLLYNLWSPFRSSRMSVQFQSSVDIIFSLFDIRSRISGLGRSPHCRFIPFGIVLHSQTLFFWFFRPSAHIAWQILVVAILGSQCYKYMGLKIYVSSIRKRRSLRPFTNYIIQNILAGLDIC